MDGREKGELLSLSEASNWASKYMGRKVTVSNITYLIQYGKIPKFDNNGNTQILKEDLIYYYRNHYYSKVDKWIQKDDKDINWLLSFDNYTEAERTKHVNRLHPYKGKFIPQLVEYFLDEHTDELKNMVFFHPGDIIIDPFCGSGTTLVEASELGIKAIGVDISEFNALISNCKVGDYNLVELERELNKISDLLRLYLTNSRILDFDDILIKELNKFNIKYFPSPEFKYRLAKGEINEEEYAKQKEIEFLSIYNNLIAEYDIKLKQDKQDTFLDKWYLHNVRNEIEYVYSLIQQIKNENIRNIATIILSRTMRSCRATTHSDLATLVEPVYYTYYCHKHKKICKPLFSILKWWLTYSSDTVKRLAEYAKLRKDKMQYCLTGDSRVIDIIDELSKVNPEFADILAKNKARGIFTSPPYVGLIDYHEQHAYAYDLFGFKRNDELEIGPLYKGQGLEARKSYIDGISTVLNNFKKYLVKDYDIFIVANDKYNLYPIIADLSGMKIVNQYKRPVLNRTEKDKNAYSESIFHLKDKSL